MKKGKEITLKRGKGLKNASIWAINSKIFRPGVYRPPPFPSSAANLYVGENNESQKRGRGK